MSQSEYRLNRDFADPDELQRYLNDIARRLVRSEERESKIDDATRNLLEFALTRIDETLRPAIELVGQISAFGLLAFEFDTEFPLTEGENILAVPDGKREAFSPTPILTFGRKAEGAEDQFATARLVDYDNETGALTVDVVGIDPALSGSYDDWWVACSAGVAPTVAALAEDAQESADSAEDSAEEAASHAAAASTWNPANYYQKSVIDAALAGKAASGHQHQIVDVSGLPAALSSKADGAAMTAALAAKADSAAMTAALAGKADGAATTAALAAKADGSATTAALATKAQMTLSAAQNASGTAVDFTGIPSWVKRIDVGISGVSLSGNNRLIVQIGDSGGIETSGYDSTCWRSGGAFDNRSDGFPVQVGSNGDEMKGILTILKGDGNMWEYQHVVAIPGTGVSIGGGDKTLSDVLTQLRVRPHGTDSFDAGKITVTLLG